MGDAAGAELSVEEADLRDTARGRPIYVGAVHHEYRAAAALPWARVRTRDSIHDHGCIRGRRSVRRRLDLNAWDPAVRILHTPADLPGFPSAADGECRARSARSPHREKCLSTQACLTARFHSE